MAQQTPIDWLVEKLNQCEPWYSGKNVPVAHINQLIEQAKELENQMIKKQSIKFVDWLWKNRDEAYILKNSWKTLYEEYINHTGDAK